MTKFGEFKGELNYVGDARSFYVHHKINEEGRRGSQVKTFKITISRPGTGDQKHWYTFEELVLQAETIEEALVKAKEMHPSCMVPAPHLKGLWEEVLTKDS